MHDTQQRGRTGYGSGDDAPGNRRFWAASSRRAMYILLVAVAAALFCAALYAPRIAAQSEGFVQQQPGQQVYDRAGVLSTDEEERLQREVAELREQTDTPAVVYLQEKEAGYSETEDDARELMSAWDLESSDGARDGLVALVNLQPPADPSGDLSGEVSLYSGEELAGGPLPQSELQRISEEEVLPLLREDDLAGGLSAGLEAAGQNIQSGGEAGGGPAYQPSPLAAALAGLPAIVFALVVGAATVLFADRLAKGTRRPPATGQITERTRPPSELSPALAARLTGQGSYHSRVEAIILDLCRRGALALEPDQEDEEADLTEPPDDSSAREGAFRLRLLDEGLLEEDHERALWRRLASRANERGVIGKDDLPAVATRSSEIEDALREDLEYKGLFDSQAPTKRNKIYLAAGIASLLAVGAGALAAVGREPLGLVAVALLIGAAVYALAEAISIPDATADGERMAAAWRSYQEGLRSAGRDRSQRVDLDEATPYAAAFGISVVIEDRLQEASDRGEVPAWFSDGAREDERSPYPAAVMGGGFAPYWFSFHGSCAPPPGTPGAAGGGFIGAGGAGGGAGAGGAGGGGGF